MKRKYYLLLLFIINCLIITAQLVPTSGDYLISNNKNAWIKAAGSTSLSLINDSNNFYVYAPTYFKKVNFIKFQNYSWDKISYIFAAVPYGGHTTGIGVSTKASYNSPYIDNLFCHPNGYVGIRNNAPQYELDVNGRINSRYMRIFKDTCPSLDIDNTAYIRSDPAVFKKAGRINFINGSMLDKVSYIFAAGPVGYHTLGIGISTKASYDSNDVDNLFCHPNGYVGIRNNNPQYELDVNGRIHAKQIIVNTTFVPADFVFKPEYKLKSLVDVEKFVLMNHHLPEIPSAKEQADKGYDVGEMQNKLLQKIEELTLYAIKQEKAIESLKETISIQNDRIKSIETK